jgi:dTDP-L-rhamnose 4-epimerase
VTPVPTPETKPLIPTSVYAVSKMDQEMLSLTVGGAYGIGVMALRIFNTYGPHQGLSNPYTGIGAIFSARLLNNRPPLLFEDGRQLRDFVHVTDVARAFVAALEKTELTGGSPGQEDPPAGARDPVTRPSGVRGRREAAPDDPAP